tara:strand:- start:544 stop:1770 length:1227 start_codon:yes stop_codon:yes gene_type:complete
MIKDTIKKLKPSSTLKINELSKQLEADGNKIYKFGFGQSPFQVPLDVVHELKNNAHKNKYLPMQGLEELRNSISKYTSNKKKQNYKAEDVIIGPGTKELMFLLHMSFDGDILLPVPSWVSYFPQANIAKNKVHWINTLRENNWFPTGEEIEKIILKNKNKNYLLILNSPNNPSGQICENLKEISDIAKKYDILILSDEIYSELSFNKDYESISNYYPDKTIISNGLSKWCGAGGWRLGHFIIPKPLQELKNSLKNLASETFSSVSAPIQYAAITAYNNNHEEYINNSSIILQKVGEYVFDNLKSNKININKPMGGFYLMPEFSTEKFSSSEVMCENILKETGVALLPGVDFGFEKKKLIARLSFTDFDGNEFMKNLDKQKNLDLNFISKFAPKIIEGTKKLKVWSESL